MWARSELYGGWDNNGHLKEVLLQMRQYDRGHFMQKKNIFVATLSRNFFSFSLSVFQNYF